MFGFLEMYSLLRVEPEPATNAGCNSEGVVAENLWWDVEKAVKAGRDGEVEE